VSIKLVRGDLAVLDDDVVGLAACARGRPGLAELPQAALVADRRGVVASTDRSLAASLEFEAVVGRSVMRDPVVVQRLNQCKELRG